MDQWRRGPVIGRGSSATVSLATTSSNKLLAVKSADISNSDMLRNEQRIMSSLNCQHIVSYLGFEVTNSEYNLFLEYAVNGSLADSMCGARLEEITIRRHTQDILSGIAYLHDNNIVHCDIKPQNILIGCDRRAKVADFGCSRRMDQDDYQVKGTPMFMAPEVVRGEEQGPEADIWAVGCTVLEMVTGNSPWAIGDVVNLVHRIAFSDSMLEIPSWVSDEGKDFLKKCLARDPKQRWKAEELLKHPFLEGGFLKMDLSLDWISPKSVLDNDVWEMFSSEDDRTEEKTDNKERVREMEECCISGPNWTWDESWVAVRSIESMDNDDDKLPLLIGSTSSSYTQEHSALESQDCDFDVDVDVMMQHSCCRSDSVKTVNRSYMLNNIIVR